MGRLEHASCGYSEYAPGCDEWDCLVHRLDVAFFKGWPTEPLQDRLDASLSAAVDAALASGSCGARAPRTLDVTDRRNP